jgi:hypothetical protein
MTESTMKLTPCVTGCASLAPLGIKLRILDLLAPIRQLVRIPQKTVKDTPFEKLYDAFISILAGAAGLVEINSRLRSDRGLQHAFGRKRCAEQSVVQETLSACTAETVKQMEQAMEQSYRRYSQGYRHDYHREYQILDVDLTGLPCGKKAALATKGYFAGARNRRGRQLGRVLATRYGEVVVDQLFEGRTKLAEAFVPLVQAAEQTLDLDEAKRARTLLRVDAGGGSLNDVNWALGRGYLILCKDYSGQRAARLAASVTRWIDDPNEPGRQVGWVELEAREYVRPVERIAVRKRKPNGQWGIAVLISNLLPAEVEELSESPLARSLDPAKDLLLAHVMLYDQRGGGVETSFKGDKQGISLGKRSKKRFEAQQMVMLLGTLAHTVLAWAREWLAATTSAVQHYGPLRLVRDVFHISGFLLLDACGRIRQVGLNQDAPLASVLLSSLQSLVAPAHVAIYLAKT